MPTPSSPWLVLAPIRGVTDAAFRSAQAAIFGGFDEALAPFLVPERDRPVRAKDLDDVSPAQNQALPTVPQILTADPELFLETARRLAQLGCTCVNWNLGCPHPQVTRRLRGAGLLPFPDKIDAFLGTVSPALGIDLSVKLRLGLTDSSEIGPVLQVLNRYPLREVILHPRTASQKYAGAVDLAAFEKAIPECNHPLVYNGDLRDVDAFLAIATRFPQVSRWMIGRGALSDPSLGLRLRGEVLTPADKLQRYRRLHDSMLTHYLAVLHGPAHVLDKLSGLWGYWVDTIPGKRKAIKKLLKVRSLERFQHSAEEILRG